MVGSLPPLTINSRYYAHPNNTHTIYRLKKIKAQPRPRRVYKPRRMKMDELPSSSSDLYSKPKVVLFYKNGDRNFRGYHVTVTPRRFRNFENLLNELTRVTNLPQGARFIFTPNSGSRIENLEQLADGKSYVCGSFPKLKKINYGCAPDGSTRKCQVSRNFIPSQNSSKMQVENDRPPTNVKPKVVTIVRNGIGRPRKHVKILLNKRTAQTYDQVLNDITSAVGVDGSSGVRKLFNANGQLVASLSKLFGEEDIFIAVGSEKFRTSEIPVMLDELGLGKQHWTSNPKLKSSPHPPISPKRNAMQKTVNKTPEKKAIEMRSLKKLPEIKKTNGVEKNKVKGPVKEEKRSSDNISAESAKISEEEHVTFSDNDNEDIDNNNTEKERAVSPENRPRNSLVVEEPVASSNSESSATNTSKSTNSIDSSESADKESSIDSTTKEGKLSNIEKPMIDVVEHSNDVDPSDNTEENISHVDLGPNDILSDSDEEKVAENESAKNGDSNENNTKFKDADDSDTYSSSSETVTIKSVGSSNKNTIISSTTSNALILQRNMERISKKIPTSEEMDDLYDFGKKLGDGNFAVVKESVEKKTGEKYAIKIIDCLKIEGKDALLRNEIKIQQECFHPNIVRLFHDYHSPTEIFLVMELISGGDFFDLIAQNIKFEEEEAAGYVRDLCSGLDYLHQRHIVHRDIKPENLMVYETSSGQQALKLADFGLAMKVTQPLFTICGTPTYVSPEILLESGYGLEVDMWAAGVIIYIMLCGFPPFRSPNRKQTELFDMIETGEFEYLEPYWDDVSDLAKDLISKILVVDIEKRFKAKQVFSHPWLDQYSLSRNDTMDGSPKKTNKFKAAARGLQSIHRMKMLLDLKLQRRENFITHISSHSHESNPK